MKNVSISYHIFFMLLFLGLAQDSYTMGLIKYLGLDGESLRRAHEEERRKNEQFLKDPWMPIRYLWYGYDKEKENVNPERSQTSSKDNKKTTDNQKVAVSPSQSQEQDSYSVDSDSESEASQNSDASDVSHTEPTVNEEDDVFGLFKQSPSVSAKEINPNQDLIDLLWSSSPTTSNSLQK